MSSSSSSSTPLSTEDAELVAVNTAIEEALTDGLSMCLRLGEQEAEVRAEIIRKEKEEDDARYFHMLREQSSGRLRLFMPAIDYEWFKYCFQGHELPYGQTAQQILDMAAVHEEIPIAAKAAATKRWMRDLSHIEAIWQRNHGADYWRLAQEDEAREFHMLREYSAGRLQEFLQLEDLNRFRQLTRDEEMPEPPSTAQTFAFERVLRDIPIRAAIARRFETDIGIYENDPNEDDETDYSDDDDLEVHVPGRVAQ